MQDTRNDAATTETQAGLTGDRGPAAGGEAAGTSAPEALPSPDEALRQAEQQAKEHYDAWLRARADADNIRKRAQEDITKAHRYALDSFSEALLPVRDSLEASLATSNLTMESLRTGVELTLKQLASVFEKFNIAEINPIGDRFDPHLHQAVAAVESNQPPNTVVQVLQKGYRLHDRVIRPALVTVAKSKDA